MSKVYFDKLDICKINNSSRLEGVFISFFENNTSEKKFSFEDKLWCDFCTEWNRNVQTIKIGIYMDRLYKFIKKYNLDTLIRYLSIYSGIGDEFDKNPIRVSDNCLYNGNHRILIIRYLIDSANHNTSIYLVNNPYLSHSDIENLQLYKVD